jgi:hypothetical protein
MQGLKTPMKAALFSSRHAGGETIPVISKFAGCAQFTPHVGFVTNPVLFPLPYNMTGLVLGVDVSHRVTCYLVTVVTRGTSRCYRMDWRVSF